MPVRESGLLTNFGRLDTLIGAGYQHIPVDISEHLLHVSGLAPVLDAVRGQLTQDGQ
jgi:hypothetical protein